MTRLLSRNAALLVAGLCATLAGCAQLHLTQGPHQAIQRTSGLDDYDQNRLAGPVAARILPYALLAEQSYQTNAYALKRAAPVPRHCVADNYSDCVTGEEDSPRAKAWLRQWRYVWGCQGPAECRTSTPGASDPVSGLGVQIWVKKGAICSEAVIAFRGTVSGNEGDWESNFHWILRVTPIYDQYDQVRDHIFDFIAHIVKDPCYRKDATQITAIGHSLGGGLAQLAAFSDAKIRRIYAFDPSMVTGFYSVDPPFRDANVRGLRGERIYEHGEILAYFRYFLRQFIPPSPCNPRIVSVRFDVLHGSPIAQHSLSDFTSALLREARSYEPQSAPMVLDRCGDDANSEPVVAANGAWK
jgi:pimeloyl-ACP methyl ester carboxylesterase